MERNLKKAVYQHINFENNFQNFFDFPDFKEMRPIIRSAVHTVAKESFAEQPLSVKVERRAVAIEEQLERETRKYQHQNGFFPNQQSELHNLIRLYTNVLQVISKHQIIDQEIEDIIYAVDQTRKSLRKLNKLDGEGPLYENTKDRDLIPDTFYYLVTQQLIRPYLIDPAGKMIPENVTHDGRKLVVQMITYCYRDWDSYLTHQYDEQYNIKNKRGLSTKQYYDELEQNELKYADHAYAEVLADVFGELEKMLVPDYVDSLDIMSTNLESIFTKHPRLRLQFNQIITDHFKVDVHGVEHVMDEPLKDIKNKYDYYRQNFS
ncbi:hypothetical protein H5S09_09755 [Limosilactobacillus sp. STM2_1]|uniref:Uncharacterized protein n=1 Tax=Limosilactobacillus rudii TaxID=2759755 RepID=A0A7W3UMB7_9LACO|nr:hypothetical protein [Limosilactobacillus rudii]MBB1078906.1 hypothetical protein [Limosilactobacillus rudii]MBB1098218.1 hypothetical protein [Limosilactobacillus rudii]MCD7135667.1 hypothetical protein [Limosilactobacillus rudii]